MEEEQKEGSALDQALESAKQMVPAAQSDSKFLLFRPYIDPMSVRPYKPQDKGYYFKNYNNVKVPLIPYPLEDNGFREADRTQEWTICWACLNIKSQLYQGMQRF